MADERGFEFPFVKGFRQGEKVKNVRVFQGLLGKVRLWRGQELVEIGHGFSVAGVSPGVDLQGQDVSAPAVGERLLHVPAAGGQVFDLLHQNDVMEPRNQPERSINQFCRSLRHNCGCRQIRHR